MNKRCCGSQICQDSYYCDCASHECPRCEECQCQCECIDCGKIGCEGGCYLECPKCGEVDCDGECSNDK